MANRSRLKQLRRGPEKWDRRNETAYRKSLSDEQQSAIKRGVKGKRALVEKIKRTRDKWPLEFIDVLNAKPLDLPAAFTSLRPFWGNVFWVPPCGDVLDRFTLRDLMPLIAARTAAHSFWSTRNGRVSARSFAPHVGRGLGN